MDDKVTIFKAAQTMKCTTAALYKAIREGRLSSEDSYGRVIVSMAEVRRYKANGKKGGRPKSRNGKRGKK